MTELSELELTNVSGGTYTGLVTKYIVGSGETILDIAEKFNINALDLMDLNHIKEIYAGQILFVPHT